MKYLISLSTIITGLVMLITPTKMANGCGASDYGYYVYSFVEPDIIEEPSYRPFFFTFMHFFDDWKGETFSKEENLEEWNTFFSSKVKSEAIEKVIYKSSIKELDLLLKGTLAPSIKDNELFRHLNKNSNNEFVNYLIYAKSCEPYATTKREFDWEGQLDVDDKYYMNASYLIEEGLTSFHSCESDFLKLRYAFQIVRMARYSFAWKEAIRLYEDLIPSVSSTKSFIQYWTMEHYAGALYNDGQKEKAAYLFAQIFDKCPSRRFPAYKSFNIRTDEEWRKTIGFCRTNEEQAALYGLRAVNPINNAVEEMKEIYKLSPKSKQLNFLLIREIQKLEYELLGADYNHARKNMKHYSYDPVSYDSYVDFPRESSKQYLRQLLTLVQKCVQENKVQQPQVWKLAEGYLQLLDGNHGEASNIFNNLESSNQSKAFKKQLRVFKAALEVDQLKTIDTATEQKIPEYLALLKNVGPQGESGVSEIANYTLDKLAYLYKQQGEITKGFLCKQLGFYDLLTRPSMTVVDDLLTMQKKLKSGQLSKYEKSLTQDIFYKSEYKYDNETGDYAKVLLGLDNEIKDKLMEIKGTIYLTTNDLDNAIATFEKLPAAYHNQASSPNGWIENPTERFNLNQFDPFNLYIGSEKRKNTDPKFNKLKLAKQLRELENNIKTGTGNIGKYYYQLGLAHFNMSNEGEGWRALDYWWSGYTGDHEISEDIYAYSKDDWGNQDFVYHDNSLSYLEKAIEISSDKELKAKALFLAGMCRTRADSEEESGRDNEYWNKLKRELKNTEFHQQVIRECDIFERY